MFYFESPICLLCIEWKYFLRKKSLCNWANHMVGHLIGDTQKILQSVHLQHEIINLIRFLYTLLFAFLPIEKMLVILHVLDVFLCMFFLFSYLIRNCHFAELNSVSSYTAIYLSFFLFEALKMFFLLAS